MRGPPNVAALFLNCTTGAVSRFRAPRLNRRDALDKDQAAVQRGSPQLERLGVFRRGVPFAQALHRRKFDDDECLRRRAAFGRVCCAAADQVAAAIMRNRFGSDGAIRLEARRVTHIDFGNNIGRHFSPHAMVWMMPPSTRSAAPLVTEASFELT